MAFKKGQSGNKNGRPKGSKNKDTEFRAAIKSGVPIELVLSEIASIDEPKDRVPHYLRLLEFAHPKLKAVEHSGEIGGENFIRITDVPSGSK